MNADDAAEPDDSGESVPRHSLVDGLAVAAEQRCYFVNGEEVLVPALNSALLGCLGLSRSPAGR